jgi:hypothetical protein
MVVEETDGNREDRWPYRGKRAAEETKGSIGDRGL